MLFINILSKSKERNENKEFQPNSLGWNKCSVCKKKRKNQITKLLKKFLNILLRNVENGFNVR